MAIESTNYLQKATRLSLYNVSPNVTTIQAGQLFHLDANGEWDYADGTLKAYPTLNVRFNGAGLGAQGERLEGRDDVSRTGKITVLVTNYELGTDQFDDTKTYTPGAPLTTSTGGKLTLFDTATGKPHLIVGYVTVPPATTGDFLRYQG